MANPLGQLWCTGQCGIFIASGSYAGAQEIQFLGFAEQKPDIDIHESDEPVFTDPGGGKEETDASWLGESATINLVLTYFTQNPHILLTTMPRTSDAFKGAGIVAPVRGTSLPGDVGTLLMTENQYPMLFIQFPYWAKPAFGNSAGPPNGMEQG